MGKQVVKTDQAPTAVGPYSQATIANGFVFVAGQVPLIPGTKNLVEGSIETMTRQALKNVQAVLEAAGSDLEHIVKTTVFLQDLSDFAAMNTAYGEFFGANPPARSTIQVAALPLAARIEIEAIAMLTDS